MPAAEQTWRNQKTLHVIFGCTGLLLLLATLWMLAADHMREWKQFQRKMRRVDTTMTTWRMAATASVENRQRQRQLEQKLYAARATLPDPQAFQAFVDELTRWAQRQDREPDTQKLVDRYKQLQSMGQSAPQAQRIRLRTELVTDLKQRVQAARFREDSILRERKFKAADYDEMRATYDLAVRDQKPPSVLAGMLEEIDRQKQQLDELTLQFQDASQHRLKLQDLLRQITHQEDQLNTQLEEVRTEYDRLAKSLDEREATYFMGQFPFLGKRWLELPIIDAFNAPLKIENLWTENLTIQNGSFGKVRRFDRCTTCHQAIDKTAAGSGAQPAYEHRHPVTVRITVPQALIDKEGKEISLRAIPRATRDPDQVKRVLSDLSNVPHALTIPPEQIDELPPDEAYPLMIAGALRAVYGIQMADRGLIDSSDVTIQFVIPGSPAATAVMIAGAADPLQAGLEAGDLIEYVNQDKVVDPADVPEFLLRKIPWGQTVQLRIQRGLPHPFCSHPRLDLFVGSLSPHPVSVFGCTICHEGEGSATEFKFASHTPNDADQMRQWVQKHGWFHNHHWIYPMFPRRFAESSCLKCHHDVVELEPSERFPDPPAPKLVNGYQLVRTYGCFGCHEINGYQGPDQRIGPDLRVEPNYYGAAAQIKNDPNFNQLSGDQQLWVQRLMVHPEDEAVRHQLLELLQKDAAAQSPVLSAQSHEMIDLLKDVETPGIMQKVGPSLRYVATKLGPTFLYDWIHNPPHFRPSTRMPRFFGQWDHLEIPSRAKAAAQRLISLLPESESALRQLAQRVTQDPDDFTARHQLWDQIAADKRQETPRLAADVHDAADELMDLAERYEPIEILGIVTYLLNRSQPLELMEPPVADSTAAAQDMRDRGKVLFETRGCLACHSHQEFPEGQATQGPDLSGIGDKLALADTPNARAWLYTWLKSPSHYHPRTKMPDLFLDPITHDDGSVTDPAADIVEFLLASRSNWQPDPQSQAALRPIEQDLNDLVLEHLSQAVFVKAAQDALEKGTLPAELAGSLRGAEAELVGELTIEKKLTYIGAKTISKYGCFGCHDIPGFEDAKPIGTTLADWGRKDPARLAFEHIAEYLEHQHAGPMASATSGKVPGQGLVPHGSAGSSAETAEREPIDEAFYHEKILDHDRIGFIWQKLKDPRSYDYMKTRNKGYHERLRMPRFRLDDHDREAVITFILGLVSEPPAYEFLYHPDPRQHALIAGKKVIEKYNCGGCHILEPERWLIQYRPGDFRPQPAVNTYPFLKTEFDAQTLEDAQKTDPIHGTRTSELVGMPDIDARGRVRVLDEEGYELEPADLATTNPATLIHPIQLWKPAILDGHPYEVGLSPIDIPASMIKRRIPPVGGDLTRTLLPRVVELERKVNPNASGQEAYGWLPPPLIDQGKKTRPDWLHDFLLDPHPIRPAVFLRMPKFNLSSQEATEIVNYFAARDQAEYPYTYDARTRGDHLTQAAAEYQKRLAEVPDSERPPGESRLDHAMNIVTNGNYCVKCHLVNDFEPAGSPRAKAPDLANVQRRLQADFVRRWIARPKQVLPYTSMPENLPFDASAQNLGGVDQRLFVGTSIQQVDGLVDLLMHFSTYTQEKTKIAPLVQAVEQPAATGTQPPAAGGSGG